MRTMKFYMIVGIFGFLLFNSSHAQSQWHMQNEIQLEKHFISLNKLYPLDSTRAVVIQWRRNSKLLIYNIENGQLEHQVFVRPEDVARLEQEIALRVVGCMMIPYEDPDGNETSKVNFETFFCDNDKYWVGWELLMRIDQNDGTYENELITILSRLTEDYDLTEHHIVLPSSMECKKELFHVFSERFHWRACNTLRNDTLYMLRQMDYLKPGHSFYEKVPIYHPEATSFSEYKYRLDDVLFWFHSTDTSDMSITYGFTFVHDSQDLLCHTYVKSELFYYDQRTSKYKFDTEPFGTLLSFEKHADHVLIASSKRIDGQRVMKLHVFDPSGASISELSFSNPPDDAQSRVYVGTTIHQGLFYIVSREGQDYFIQTYSYH